MHRSAYFAFALPLVLLTTVANAQTEDRAERWRDNCERGWNNDRATVCELRTYTIASGARISVDGGPNGGVTFIGENRRDVKIVARVQASADDDATAGAIAKQIRIVTDGGEPLEGPSRGRSWSVSYDVYVPNQTNPRRLPRTAESRREIQGQMNRGHEWRHSSH
jgi:hypothetical protein